MTVFSWILEFSNFASFFGLRVSNIFGRFSEYPVENATLRAINATPNFQNFKNFRDDTMQYFVCILDNSPTFGGELVIESGEQTWTSFNTRHVQTLHTLAISCAFCCWNVRRPTGSSVSATWWICWSSFSSVWTNSSLYCCGGSMPSFLKCEVN